MPEEWRCSGCRTLLGVERGGKLFLRYKQVQYVVVGEVIAICRTCGLANDRATPGIPDRTPRAHSPP